MKIPRIIAHRLSILLCGALYLLGLATCAQTAPNIIYIKTDDQRYDALSMTGHPVTQTPNIDQLAKEGVFFNHAFITSPVCGPSRANTFSGQWERKNRIGFSGFHGNDMTAAVFDKSWLLQLKGAGYSTGYIGKHHVNVGRAANKKYLERSLDFAYLQKGHLGFDLSKRPAFSNLRNPTQVEGLLEATEVFLEPNEETDYFFETADASVKDFLTRRDEAKPFALSINFNLPHAASIGGMGAKNSDPEIYKSLYEDRLEDFVMPADFLSAPEPLPASVFHRDELMPYYQYKSTKGLLSNMLKMARANAAIDLFVKSLRERLDVMGIADNTIIVYASDHGLLLGEKGLGGKTFLYDDSVRIPLIFYSPTFSKQQRGKTHEDLVVGQDIPATILDLCGVAVPDTYQGESLVPIIDGSQTNWRQEVFLENLFTKQGYPRMEAVRSAEWKYIRYFSREHDRDQYLPNASIHGEQPVYEELYHLKTDPTESNNLSKAPEHQATFEAYRTRCREIVFELSR